MLLIGLVTFWARMMYRRQRLAPLAEMLERLWFTVVLGSPAVISLERQLTSASHQALAEREALSVTH